MSPIVLSVTIVAYFAILFTISYIAGHKADNELSKPKYYPNLTFYCIEYQ